MLYYTKKFKTPIQKMKEAAVFWSSNVTINPKIQVFVTINPKNSSFSAFTNTFQKSAIPCCCYQNSSQRKKKNIYI